MLCPGLRVRFENEATGEKDEWFYTGALAEYLLEQIGKTECLPKEPLTGKQGSERDAVEWALVWAPNLPAFIAESYVNLIPTAGGGTHVNGLRGGVCAAVREFAEFRNLLPRGVKLTPEDIWNGVSFVLSISMKDPQFAGQTKERLGSREAAALVEGYARDTTALWLNQHPDAGERIAQFAIENAQERIKAAQRSRASARCPARRCPASSPTAARRIRRARSCSWSRATPPAAPPRQARDRNIQAVMPLRGKILNTWELEHGQVASSEEVHNISIAIGVDPGSGEASTTCATTRSASSPTPIPTASTSRRCCARCSCGTSGRW